MSKLGEKIIVCEGKEVERIRACLPQTDINTLRKVGKIAGTDSILIKNHDAILENVYLSTGKCTKLKPLKEIDENTFLVKSPLYTKNVYMKLSNCDTVYENDVKEVLGAILEYMGAKEWKIEATIEKYEEKDKTVNSSAGFSAEAEKKIKSNDANQKGSDIKAEASVKADIVENEKSSSSENFNILSERTGNTNPPNLKGLKEFIEEYSIDYMELSTIGIYVKKFIETGELPTGKITEQLDFSIASDFEAYKKIGGELKLGISESKTGLLEIFGSFTIEFNEKRRTKFSRHYKYYILFSDVKVEKQSE